MPVFFLLEDSLPAGVHGTSLPSLSFMVVAPFFAFAGHAGGPGASAAGVEVLPDPPELLEEDSFGLEVLVEESTVPVVAGGLALVVDDSAAPVVLVGGVATTAVLPSSEVP